MLRVDFVYCVLICTVVAATGLAADGFRCETDVFVATEKDPVQQTLTVFDGEFAYDFLLGQSKEITVFDIKHGTIKLLDPKRELCCTIPTDELLRITALYKTQKAESDLFKFCTEPKFSETFTEDKLRLASEQVKYDVVCVKPEQRGAEQRYREFADWSAQLNATQPGSLPPFPRMELNQALAKRAMLPEEITRTITTTHFGVRRSEVVRSQHRFNWQLAMRDHKLIDEVGDHLVNYKNASFEDYLGLGKKTAQK
jgi:hypothetical protein